MRNQLLKQVAIDYGFHYHGWQSGSAKLSLGLLFIIRYPSLKSDKGKIRMFIVGRPTVVFESEAEAIAFLRERKALGGLDVEVPKPAFGNVRSITTFGE